MSTLQLIVREILHRKLNFVMSALAVATAVALFVSFFTTSEASDRETIRLTRDMGFNLRIIPKETHMEVFWVTGFSDHFMPEEYVFRFAGHEDFSYAHLTATLHKKIEWRGREIILTGIAPEIEPSGQAKSPMSPLIETGTIIVGFEPANGLSLKRGDRVDILGRTFTVASTLSETGSDEDVRIYARLEEAQEILHLQGRINEIRALNCLCLTSDDEDPLVILRSQLDQVLPEAKVIMNQTIAVARERQRLMFEKYFALVMPIVLVACGVWIGTLAMTNVRDRRQEIGVMRALGYSSGKVAGLFFGKAIVLGLAGAVIGFYAGTWITLKYGPGIFKVTASAIEPMNSLLVGSLIIAPAFASLSMFIPAMFAITLDPAETLREV